MAPVPPIASELRAILAGECMRLDADRHALRSDTRTDEASATALALSLLDDARARLGDLMVRSLSPATHHNLLLIALRSAAFARAAALRHTPPLAGAPRALAPAQQPRDDAALFSDYARSGSILFEAPELAAHVRAEPHPILHAVERQLSATVWGPAAPRALLFSSGMGAMATALEHLASAARRSGQRVLLGQASWMEVRTLAMVDHGDVVQLFDETREESWAAAKADPQVLAVCSETIVNDPTLPVAIPRPLRADQVLLVDAAHTPEFRPHSPRAWSVISGVKCLGAGLDLGKSGLLAIHAAAPPDADAEWDALLERRERSGRVPSYEEAFLAALDTAETFRARHARLDANTQRLAEILVHEAVRSPWQPTHTHHARALALYGTGGRFVYLAAPRALAHTILEGARAQGLPLISACTFGLAVPILSTIVHPTAGPVLRLSPGSGPIAEVEALGAIALAALRGLSR